MYSPVNQIQILLFVNKIKKCNKKCKNNTFSEAR